MKRYISFISLFVFAGVLLASCKKEKINPEDAENIHDLGGDTWVQGPIDDWIRDSLTSIYNIDVKYKWNQFEDLADITAILVPPKEEIIIPLLSSLKKAWIDTYSAEGGEEFFKKIVPKNMYMVGSPAFNPNGSVKQGVAEGGRKIIVLDINRVTVKGMPGYTAGDSVFFKRMLWIIQHEFAHILHMNIMYPQDFKNINPSLITSNWTDYSDAEAVRDGFVSNYAMNVSDDDFVETITYMLIEGKAGFEQLIASIPEGVTDRGTTRDQAVLRLRTKESIIVNYYKQVWNIDFYKLQTRVRAAVTALIN
ncbi:MAG: hypothetical protein KF862_22410 [Chitinophagaceae bacterium]|nr:hypothetical protein [Chitinophagaceae bacterium]